MAVLGAIEDKTLSEWTLKTNSIAFERVAGGTKEFIQVIKEEDRGKATGMTLRVHTPRHTGFSKKPLVPPETDSLRRALKQIFF